MRVSTFLMMATIARMIKAIALMICQDIFFP